MRTTGRSQRAETERSRSPMSDYELIMIIMAIAGLIVDILILALRTKK